MHTPKWIPIEELNFFGHKLYLKDEKTGIMGAGTPKEDGTFDWGWPEVNPTHYWSF